MGSFTLLLEHLVSGAPLRPPMGSFTLLLEHLVSGAPLRPPHATESPPTSSEPRQPELQGKKALCPIEFAKRPLPQLS